MRIIFCVFFTCLFSAPLFAQNQSQQNQAQEAMRQLTQDAEDLTAPEGGTGFGYPDIASQAALLVF